MIKLTPTQRERLAQLLADHRFASAHDLPFCAGVRAAMEVLVAPSDGHAIERRWREIAKEQIAGEVAVAETIAEGEQ